MLIRGTRQGERQTVVKFGEFLPKLKKKEHVVFHLKGNEMFTFSSFNFISFLWHQSMFLWDIWEKKIINTCIFLRLALQSVLSEKSPLMGLREILGNPYWFNGPTVKTEDNHILSIFISLVITGFSKIYTIDKFQNLPVISPTLLVEYRPSFNTMKTCYIT